MSDFIALHQQLNRIENKLDRLLQGEQQLMNSQQDIDAAVTQLGLDQSALNDAAQRILAEISTLQGQGVDTSGLSAAVAALDSAVGPIVQIAPPSEPFSGQNTDAATGFVWKESADETFTQSQERLFAFNAGKDTSQQVAQPYPTMDEWNALTVS